VAQGAGLLRDASVATGRGIAPEVKANIHLNASGAANPEKVRTAESFAMGA
jgi:hypothetical protein